MTENGDEELASLTPEQRQAYDDLRDRFAALGAPDPDGWALSEVTEDTPQLARFVLLRRLWPELIAPYEAPDAWIGGAIAAAQREPQAPFADAGAALRRLLERGASPSDLAAVARMVAYESVFGVLSMVDEGYDPASDTESPGWRLVEVDEAGDVTGREVGGLHEDLLTLDPSGRDGRPA